MKKRQKVYLPFKRIIGIIGSFVGIIFCSAFLWWWILIVNSIVTHGHPIFVQKRLGKNKKVFGILKFRTMSLDFDENTPPFDMSESKQKEETTKFGKFLRKTSLDETLQLFNIFIGQMAFIGPRPGAAINEDYLIKARDSFNPSAFAVKPGLGGYAQSKLNREHDPMLKAKFDHEYVVKLSFWFDFKLFLLTVLHIFGVGKGR